eukprot:1942730-Amphidinium_carterae.1
MLGTSPRKAPYKGLAGQADEVMSLSIKRSNRSQSITPELDVTHLFHHLGLIAAAHPVLDGHAKAFEDDASSVAAS